jgi:FlaA1/EpsC-like NDP-sugar epimerase
MSRYFMSVHEAVLLVLQAAAMANGGEVFTLDMGEPMLIVDLANKLIRLSGQVPGRDIPISFIGPRPGEKVAEEIVAPGETPSPTAHPSIVVATPPVPDRLSLRRAIRELEGLANDALREELSARMLEYSRPRQEWAVSVS